MDYRIETIAKLHWLGQYVVTAFFLRNQFGMEPKIWELVSPLPLLEAGELGSTPLMIVKSSAEFFGISCLNAEADHIFAAECALAAALRCGSWSCIETINGIHF